MPAHRNLAHKRVLVTGGAGFLGRHVVARLVARGAQPIVPRRAEYDLRREADVERLFAETRPEVVLHAAVHGGGIGYMRRHPGEIAYDNLIMNTLVVEASRRHTVEKFVGVGTICSYPKFTPVPFREEDLWAGYPEETNGAYGMAKKMMLVQTASYHEQWGFPGIHLLLVNMYGPHDDFSDESSHVIPALIKRFLAAKEAGEPHVVCWGDGSPSREFLYVDDAAEGILLATERYEHPDPVNLGVGAEITIFELAHRIAEAVGYPGEIRWDPTKPNGQPRRCLDVTKAEQGFGFKATTGFEEGLATTLRWYLAERRPQGVRP